MDWPAADAGPLPLRYAGVRARTLELAAPLSEEDCCVQSMPDASPVKWHLAHTTWFFETFVLEQFEPGFKPFHADFRVLFNSYYNGVGDKHPRPQRGMLSRPSLATVRDYRQDVDRRTRSLFERYGKDKALQALITLGLNHEQQHQELILSDCKHLLSLNPLKPVYRDGPLGAPSSATALEWTAFSGGVVAIGAGNGDAGFCFDNELPRHNEYLQPYSLASRLVTNGEYLQFVENGGYRDPRLWLSEGWDWMRAIACPIYWMKDQTGWKEFTLAGMRTLDLNLPVAHISYFEADAYARWAGARLPTEAEWEQAACGCAAAGNFADNGEFHPRAARGTGLQQMFGDAWEWTSSSYAPYPGYRPVEGAIGEYNGKFMVNQYVLRGGSCATPSDHIRPTYRNFFPASARWQFSGIRLARDAAGTGLSSRV